MMMNSSETTQNPAYGKRMACVWHAYATCLAHRVYEKFNTARLLTILVATMMFTAFASTLPATAQDAKLNIGDTYLCSAENGLPPVSIWVGKIDRVNFSSDQGDTSVLVLHLQVIAEDGPMINHAPFKFEALKECLRNQTGNEQRDSKQFTDGYKKWKAGLKTSQTPFLNTNPATVYWTALGKQ